MPEKTTTNGRAYEIDGKTFTWHPEDDNGEVGNAEPIAIPMRIKLKVLRSLSSEELTPTGMFTFLETIIPHQAEALDEMDINDFTAMFETWQTEYNALTGATLPESSGSSS
jgi:hypothetical protein